MRADALANNLASKDYRNLGKHIRKFNNNRSTLYATGVGGCTGDSNITDMWMQHYQQFYNSVSDTDAKVSLLQRISNMPTVTM